MKIEKLQPGMTVYDVHRHKLGNTTISSVGVWEVVIVSVDTEYQSVVARWNGNKERTYYRNTWSKWRANRPMLIRSPMGYSRLATRAEIAAAKVLAQCRENQRTVLQCVARGCDGCKICTL